MADDRHDDPPQEGSRPKRAPPTIDLEATEISRDAEISKAAEEAGPGETGNAAQDPPPPIDEPTAAPHAPTQKSSIVVAAIAGAVAAACVVGGSWLADWPGSSSAPQVGKTELGDLSNRVANIESKTAKPLALAPPDAAAVARIDALEKSVASLREELTTVREQSGKLEAAVKDMAPAPREAANAPDMSAITARLAAVEQTAKTLTAETARHDAAPADDAPLRRVVAATLLDVSVRNGESYGDLLATSKSLAANSDVLKPLEAFASSGVPKANALCRELLAIVPKLAPAPVAATTGNGLVSRLQEGAARLVRIERTDGTAGNSPNAVVARITAAALHNDIAAARKELSELPAGERAAAQAWLARADARDAALAASHQFAADAMTALTKPAR